MDAANREDRVELPLDERAVHAHLGCICARPGTATDGEWVLLLEDFDRRPLAMMPVGLVFDSAEAPLQEAIEALHRAGYQAVPKVVVKPWAASWSITAPTAD